MILIQRSSIFMINDIFVQFASALPAVITQINVEILIKIYYDVRGFMSCTNIDSLVNTINGNYLIHMLICRVLSCLQVH